MFILWYKQRLGDILSGKKIYIPIRQNFNSIKLALIYFDFDNQCVFYLISTRVKLQTKNIYWDIWRVIWWICMRRIKSLLYMVILRYTRSQTAQTFTVFTFLWFKEAWLKLCGLTRGSLSFPFFSSCHLKVVTSAMGLFTACSSVSWCVCPWWLII